MGMAHNLWDDVSVRITGSLADGREDIPSALVHVRGEGADALPTDESHLIVRALRYALNFVGAEQPRIELTCENGILQGRVWARLLRLPSPGCCLRVS